MTNVVKRKKNYTIIIIITLKKNLKLKSASWLYPNMVSYNDSSAQTTEAWRSIDSTLRLDLFTLKNSLQGDTHTHIRTHTS